MPELTFTLEITEDEKKNFLERFLRSNVGDPDDLTTVVPFAAEQHAAIDAAHTAVSESLVDKNKVPWNESFHASTKAMKADGSWKRRKGANAIEATKWEKAHRDANEQGANEHAPTLPLTPAAAVPTLPTVPAAVVPTLPVVPEVPTIVTHQGLIAKMSEFTNTFGDEYLTALLAGMYAKHGIVAEELPENETHRDLIDKTLDQFIEIGLDQERLNELYLSVAT